MEHPTSYVDQTHPNLVCRVKKNLCGLKQTLRAWSNKIGQYLVISGFQTSNVNVSFYVKKTDLRIVILVIYVDDLIIIGDSDVNISDVKKLLKQNFEIKELGKLRYLLNIEVIQSCKRDMVTTKTICLEQIVRIWDDKLQTHFNSIGAKCEVKCK